MHGKMSVEERHHGGAVLCFLVSDMVRCLLGRSHTILPAVVRSAFLTACSVALSSWSLFTFSLQMSAAQLPSPDKAFLALILGLTFSTQPSGQCFFGFTYGQKLPWGHL